LTLTCACVVWTAVWLSCLLCVICVVSGVLCVIRHDALSVSDGRGGAVLLLLPLAVFADVRVAVSRPSTRGRAASRAHRPVARAQQGRRGGGSTRCRWGGVAPAAAAAVRGLSPLSHYLVVALCCRAVVLSCCSLLLVMCRCVASANDLWRR
jgi:hypothetical protein